MSTLLSNRIALVSTALMLALGAGGAASAATKKYESPHPRTQASLQCSAEANAKGLHGRARVAFRRACMRRAAHHASVEMNSNTLHKKA